MKWAQVMIAKKMDLYRIYTFLSALTLKEKTDKTFLFFFEQVQCLQRTVPWWNTFSMHITSEFYGQLITSQSNARWGLPFLNFCFSFCSD